MDYKTSVEVADELGIELNSLTSYLAKHPHLRPQRRAGTSFMWTPADVERLIEYRASNRRWRKAE